MNKFNNYSNEDLLKGINSLCRQILKDSYKPDLIIGVLRGGAVPGVYLSHWLECPMATLEWSTRDNAVGQNFDDRIKFALNRNSNILFVDDICDSGLTLKQIYDYVQENNFIASIKSSVLHYNIGQDLFEPDYYHLEINKNEDRRWVVYPWEDK